jgi:uncharacterized membrane protein
VTPQPGDLEHRFRWLSVAVVILFGAAFAVGLVFYALDQDSRAGGVLLHAGLLLLMAAPGVRMAIASADRLHRRDWTFLAMTSIVVLELAIVVWRATAR